MPKFANPDKIYPRRLGLFRNNGLVIQYYNVGQDKFRKHLITFDPHAAADTIVEHIMRDPKHAPFLKKVQNSILRRVIAGEAIQKLQENNSFTDNIVQPYSNLIKNNQSSLSHNEQYNSYNQNISYQRNAKEVEIPSIEHHITKQYAYNDDSQVLKKSQISLGKVNISVAAKKIDDQYANYDQDFEQYNDQVFQEMQLSQSLKQMQKTKINTQQQKKQEKVKQKKIKDPILQQFDFIDDKPKKKKSKGKSKQKKDKKQKPSSKKKQKLKQQAKIQDEFQFL